MKKILLSVFTVVLLLGLWMSQPATVRAQDVCNGVHCNWVWLPYTWYSCTGSLATYNLSCQWQTEMREVCQIPQSGGGACACCWPDGCYLNCPGINPPGNNNPPEPPPVGSSPTPIPTPTPTPVPGTVRMRAVSVPSATSTCAQLGSSTSYIASGITLYPPGITRTTPIDGTYATWNNQPVIPPYTTYSFSDTPPSDYVLKIACWTRDAPGASAQGYAADLYSGSTLTWNLGYTAGVGWWQAQGGDVYASAALRSYVPASTSPRYAVLDGDGGAPGVVQYGTTYDFASSSTSTGDSYMSSKRWIAKETYAPTDYYAVMLHRFGNPDADYTGDTTFTSELASRPEPYYVNGNLTITTADWNATAGETIIVLVNGNITINRKINLTGTGFVAFIVNGNITVDPSVGVLYFFSTPTMDGSIYIG